ncbi:MAG: hypothetical protein HOH04_01880 [Rhodospirillaceae bacterium]|jgi:cobalt transporter subunit CbtA|nr:hypothetical protein [Rhodospirillaceae bacterium]
MQRIVMTALLAGALAGLAVFVLHMWQTTPLILHAEVFESGEAAAPNAATQEHQQAVDFTRHAYSLLADVITAIGFSFLLVGAMAISGRHIDWQNGIVWGLCGFAALFIAPALGSPPELPGMVAAELGERQAWWLGTAMFASVALALIFFAPGALSKALAALLLIAPHAYGAPHPVMEAGNVPAELAAQFAVTSLVVNGLFWMVLGGLAGYFYDRFEPA